MSKIEKSFKVNTIDHLIHMQNAGKLNLEPSFQRESVWNLSDQQGLIQSILSGFPIPSIYLYQRFEDGKLIYDVLDGKQRLESIFSFIGAQNFTRKGFIVRHKLPTDDQPTDCTWRSLSKKDSDAYRAFLSYEIQVTEVTGDLSDIIELFVCINSTGKALTRQERANAKYFKSSFLKKAKQLAEQHRAFLTRNGIISHEQRKRMKDVELIGELLASILNYGPIDKKKALDQAIANESLPTGSLSNATSGFNAIIRILERIFPHGLKGTRFQKTSEFYSLFMVLWQLREDGSLFTPQTCQRAYDALIFLTNGIDAVKILQDEGKGIKSEYQVLWQYLSSVREGTDSRRNREIRAKILRQTIGDIFEKKDARRFFTPEQRRLLFHSTKEPRCAHPECGVKLTWDNYHVDHKIAHSRGGRTTLSQAQMLCIRHNTAKGAR